MKKLIFILLGMVILVGVGIGVGSYYEWDILNGLKELGGWIVLSLLHMIF